MFQWGRSDQPDILIQEGPYIRFCHRAFQDYFAALFICEASDSIAGRLIEEISDRFETDKVFPLVLSINDEKEKRWILPDVKMISDFVKATHDTDRYARAIVGGIEDISNVMYKIRVLYQFDPPFPLLKAPYDAAQDMKIRISRLVRQDAKFNLFERDRKNFIHWAERLIIKYERRSSALDEL